MPGNNKFLSFATGGTPNVIDDATYAALAARTAGFSSGVAQSAQLNKAWRQSSVMAAVLGQIIANNGVDASDSDSVATLVTNLLAAILASPTLTGDPKAPTPATTDNDTSIATSAFVKAVVASYAPLDSPTLTGDPKAPTPATSDNDTSIATTAFVKAVVASYLTTAAAASTYAALTSFTNSLSGNGYQKLPGGLIIQWGQVAASFIGTETDLGNISYPISFPNAALWVNAGMLTGENAQNTDSWAAVRSFSNSSVNLYICSSTIANRYSGATWIAIGY